MCGGRPDLVNRAHFNGLPLFRPASETFRTRFGLTAQNPPGGTGDPTGTHLALCRGLRRLARMMTISGQPIHHTLKAE